MNTRQEAPTYSLETQFPTDEKGSFRWQRDLWRLKQKEKENLPTPVMFRRFKKKHDEYENVIAIFPNIWGGGYKALNVQTFQETGGHNCEPYYKIMDWTTFIKDPLNDKECKNLFDYLEKYYEYKFKIVKKQSRKQSNEVEDQCYFSK